MVTKAELQKLTVVKLRDKLRKKSLDDKGKKDDLIKRLLEADSGTGGSKKEQPTRTSKRTRKVIEEEEDEDESSLEIDISESSEEEKKETQIDYAQLTVPKLRKLCEDRGLDSSGRKQQLIDRLEGEEDAEPDEMAAEEQQTKKRTRAQAAPTRRSARKPKKIESESEGESESEEESSEEAPPAKRPVSPKNIGKATVDKECHLAGSGTVFGEYDCMLNQTNISNNNNKFYVIQLISCNGSFYVYTRWGRVGERGQNACKAQGSLDKAKTEFMKKFKAKTGNIWGKPFTPKPRLYTQIEMSYEDTEEMAEKLAALDGDEPTTHKVITKASVLDKPTQEFMSLIFNENMFKEQMVKYDLDVKKMPLGQLSKSQINEGYTALKKVKKALDSGANRAKLEQLTNEFYTKIPHSFGRTRPPVLDNAEVVLNKMEMLAVLGDIEIAMNLTDKKTKKTKKKGETVTEKPNPLDSHYESLHCDLTYVDNDTDEFKLIQTYAYNTSSHYKKAKIKSLWRVEREGSAERFAQHKDVGNRKLLWHGTNIAVVAAILNSGLRIMPHSGGRVGRGIYFASENGKSSAYVSCSKGTGVMFLGEAVLGKEHHIDTDDPSLRAAPPGYDSIIAQGRMEPDPAGDEEVEFDGHTVVVPTGKPIKQPKWQHSRFQNTEYLVYKESQAQLRYVMAVEFTH